MPNLQRQTSRPIVFEYIEGIYPPGGNWHAKAETKDWDFEIHVRHDRNSDWQYNRKKSTLILFHIKDKKRAQKVDYSHEFFGRTDLVRMHGDIHEKASEAFKQKVAGVIRQTIGGFRLKQSSSTSKNERQDKELFENAMRKLRARYRNKRSISAFLERHITDSEEYANRSKKAVELDKREDKKRRTRDWHILD